MFHVVSGNLFFCIWDYLPNKAHDTKQVDSGTY